MFVEKRFILLIVLFIQSGTSQQSNTVEDETNPLMDMASMFLQEALNNQVGGNGGSAGATAGLAGVASLVGSFMQANGGGGGGGGQGGKSTAAAGAMQILSGIGSILASAAGGGASNGNSGNGGSFDPAIVGNVLQMFTNSVTSANGAHSELNDDDDDDDDADLARSNSKQQQDSGLPLESILKVATAFINSNNNGNNNIQQIPSRHQQKKRSLDNDDDMRMSNSLELDPQPEGTNTLLSLLPLAMKVMNSFIGPEGKETQERHQNHAWALPPYLENLHILWDHFSSSDLADALYEKSGVNKILKGFRGRDGKVDYDGLFQSLNNQAFRRRWIKSATLYLADWASYLATPEVYLKYFNAAQIMFNAFIKTQDYPKETFFDPNRPTETISNLFNHIAKHHLNVKIDSQQYVKPAVGYAKELLKLGQARGLLQFNATELSDKLTDTLNLEVIEPVLKVHRAYRFIAKNPNCDRYILCELNSHNDQNASQPSRGLISGVSSKIVKIGSMGAAIFISTETGTPFWTLFSVINSPNKCETKYPSDCNGFHVGEAEVTTEYIHNEL